MRLLIFFLLVLPGLAMAQKQYPDTLYKPFIAQAAYAEGEGPRILFDVAHHNHGAELDALAALRQLAERDGYQTGHLEAPVERQRDLKEVDILIIVNAIHADNKEVWAQPVHSAFSDREIQQIERWVRKGGSLLLAADHMPFGGAAADLGRAFGAEWLDGFAKINPSFWPPSHFEGEQMLPPSPVRDGLFPAEAVSRVASFTGSAFKPPIGATTVLQFLPEHVSLQTESSWQFTDSTPSIDLEAYAQGAIMEYGKGRVAFWGEAGMMIAQVFNDDWKGGFNSPYAPENAQLTLNLLHWLSRTESYSGPHFDLPVPDTSQLQREILTANRAMEMALKEDDMLSLSYFYDDDAVLIAPGGETRGREAIDEYWFRFAGRGIDWQLENIRIEGEGNYAFQEGRSHLRYRKDDGEEHLSVVRFTLVWRKNFAGKWKIVVDQYN